MGSVGFAAGPDSEKPPDLKAGGLLSVQYGRLRAVPSWGWCVVFTVVAGVAVLAILVSLVV